MSTEKTLLDTIYSDLLGMKIELDITNVPTPTYILDKIVSCNNLQRRVEKYFLEIKRSTTLIEKNFRIKKVGFDSKKRGYLTNDLNVKKIPTVKEREAYVEGLLEIDLKELLDLENDLNEHKSILDSIKLVERNLKGTNSDIKALVKIMEQQINRLNIGTTDDPEMSSFAKDLGDLDALEKELDLEDAEEYVNEYESDDDDDVPPTPVEDEDDIIVTDGLEEEGLVDIEEESAESEILMDLDISDDTISLDSSDEEDMGVTVDDLEASIDTETDGLPDEYIDAFSLLPDEPSDDLEDILDTDSNSRIPKKGSITSDDVIDLGSEDSSLDLDILLDDLDDTETEVSIGDDEDVSLDETDPNSLEGILLEERHVDKYAEEVEGRKEKEIEMPSLDEGDDELTDILDHHANGEEDEDESPAVYDLEEPDSDDVLEDSVEDSLDEEAAEPETETSSLDDDEDSEFGIDLDSLLDSI